jgi:hypothetical protein
MFEWMDDVAMAGRIGSEGPGCQNGMTRQWHNRWSYRKHPEVRMEMDGSYLSDMEMARRSGDGMT